MYDHIEQRMRELEIYEGESGMATKRDAQVCVCVCCVCVLCVCVCVLGRHAAN
jgi:hypothetical protein